MTTQAKLMPRDVGPWGSRAVGRAPRFIASASLFAFVACSLYVDTDRNQCSRDEECHGRGGLPGSAVCVLGACSEAPVSADSGVVDALPEDPVWGCLGKAPPLAASEPAAPVDYRVGFINVVSRGELSELGLKACASSDRDCKAPLAGSETKTGTDGIATVRVHSGFRGFLEIGTSPDIEDLVPSLLYVQPVPDKARPEGYPTDIWGLVTKSSFAFIAASADKEVKKGYGHVFFHASDCSGKPASGVTVRAEPIAADTFIYYLDAAGSPGLTQTSTEDLGIGGYLNLPPGTTTLTYTRFDGARIGSDEVIVREDQITYVRPFPSPSLSP